MRKDLGMFALTLFVLTLIVAIALTLMAVPTTPLPWVLIAILAVIPYAHRKVMARRFLHWDDAYSTGIEAIDNDHRRLLNLVNQFQTAIHYPTGETFEREALDALVDYTKTHFAREEALMEQYDYPDYAAHKQEHQRMIAKVEELMARYSKAPARTLEEALLFLKKWLIEHIGGTDQQYAGFFRSKGVD